MSWAEAIGDRLLASWCALVGLAAEWAGFTHRLAALPWYAAMRRWAPCPFRLKFLEQLTEGHSSGDHRGSGRQSLRPS